MSSKLAGMVIMFTVLTLSLWQVYRLSTSSRREPGVLATTTSSSSLEDRVRSLENRVYVLEKTTGLIRSNSSVQQKEQYKQLQGGSVTANAWTKIPGTDFTFDSSLYGSGVEVSWQGWIENGNGYVRLYDATNHRAVDYSDIFVQSGSRASFYSKPMAIWRGQNDYYIEGKNVYGVITVTSPRLKIVSR